MPPPFAALLACCALALSSPAQIPAPTGAEARAVLVVTGMRFQGPSNKETRDLSVAEGATVTLTPKDKEPRQRKTSPLSRALRGGAEATFFTADFPVDLDASYDVAITFRNGTVVRVPGIRLPSNWKTHFLFHSTRGTKSPASILRLETDPATKLSCYVYALWPVSAYESMTGRKAAQLE
jgi:hypothetical protein